MPWLIAVDCPGTQRGTLHLIACAAPPARRLPVPIRAAQEDGWDVCAILTPSAYRWTVEDAECEIEALQQLTGHPVRRQYKLPSQADALPEPDAMLVAPLSCNALNKWSACISDTLALGLITEAIRLQIPTVALPHWNRARARTGLLSTASLLAVETPPAVASDRHTDRIPPGCALVALGDVLDVSVDRALIDLGFRGHAALLSQMTSRSACGGGPTADRPFRCVMVGRWCAGPPNDTGARPAHPAAPPGSLVRVTRWRDAGRGRGMGGRAPRICARRARDDGAVRGRPAPGAPGAWASMNG